MRFSVKSLVLSSVFFWLGAPAFSDILDASDDRALVEADLSGMDKATLRFARNEIFARHGYQFKSADLTAYFSQFSWYSPRTRDVSLSSVEDLNVAFIKSYEDSPQMIARLQAVTGQTVQQAAPSTAPETQQTIVVVQQSAQVEIPVELQQEFDRMQGEVEALKLLLNSQESDAKDIGGQATITAEISRLIEQRTPELAKLEADSNGKYLTPLRPTVSFLKPTTRQLSEYWPRVPYYKPGKDEQGEFFLAIEISDSGSVLFNLNFVDPNSSVQAIIDTWQYSEEDIQLLLGGLRGFLKANDKLAASGITKVYSKQMVCFPEAQCGEKKKGNTSTEVVLTMNEDGAIGAQLIRNRGAVPETYAMSAPSAALLTSYFDFIVDYGVKENEAASMTSEDIDKLLEE